jgi:hypothetical protein
MRAAAIVALACAGWAQFKSTVPLVVAPTTVTDSKGNYVPDFQVKTRAGYWALP